MSEVDTLLSELGLRHAAAILPAWLERAAHQEVGYTEFLLGLLEEERTARANAQIQAVRLAIMRMA